MGLGLTIMGAVLATTTLRVKAQAGSWCALYHGGNQDCSFATFDQCQQTSAALGGACVQNSGKPLPPSLLQRLWQQRQQNTPQLPGSNWMPPPPDSGD
jgi:hypothetical protein